MFDGFWLELWLLSIFLMINMVNIPKCILHVTCTLIILQHFTSNKNNSTWFIHWKVDFIFCQNFYHFTICYFSYSLKSFFSKPICSMTQTNMQNVFKCPLICKIVGWLINRALSSHKSYCVWKNWNTVSKILPQVVQS